jgi:hypothetical protein
MNGVDTLVQRFHINGLFVHDMSVDALSMGSVFSNGKCADGEKDMCVLRKGRLRGGVRERKG